MLISGATSPWFHASWPLGSLKHDVPQLEDPLLSQKSGLANRANVPSVLVPGDHVQQAHLHRVGQVLGQRHGLAGGQIVGREPCGSALHRADLRRRLGRQSLSATGALVEVL